MDSVLIDASALQSEHRTRGVGAYVREFIAHTEVAPGRRPWYFASTSGREHTQGVLPEERTVHAYRPHVPAQLYWTYNELALRLALLRTRPRLFLAPDFNGLVPNPFGLTVAVLHDLAHLKSGGPPSRGPSEGLSDLRWRVYHKKLRRADHIIVRSHSVQDDAARLLGLDPARMTVVAQGLDHDVFRPRHGQGAYADRPPYFVHVGGRNSNKNQARIVEAFAQVLDSFGDTRMYFAGPWSAADLAWLAAESRRLGLGERICHLGYVPEDELASLYGNATAVVFPSLEEGYGLPVLEGMASGGPVITSNTSSMPEVAGDAARLVNPLDSGDIARAMCALRADDGLRDELRQRGYRRASGFSWSALTDEVWQVLDELLSR